MAQSKIKSWKHSFKDVFVSEKLTRYIRRKKLPDLQKFWLGQTKLKAPPLEEQYFSDLRLDGQILGKKDDYRPAAYVEKNIDLPVRNENKKNEFVQFAVCGAGPVGLKASLTISYGESSIQIDSIPTDEWQDVRLNISPELKSIQIESTSPFYTTIPRSGTYALKNTGEPRHVLVLAMDAFSSMLLDLDHPFRKEASAMPNIDRFFKKGIQIKNGHSSGEWTLPSVGALFSGQYATRHKMYHPRKWSEFDRTKKTLPEYFQNQGYHTLCGSVVSRVTPAFGYSRGFDRFLYHFPALSEVDYNPAVWIQEIISHLETHHGDKTFSYIHFPDTHPVWDTPPDTRYFKLGKQGSVSLNHKELFKSKNVSYDKEDQAKKMFALRLAELDRMLGNLFDYLEREFGDDFVVAVTADHGIRMPHLSEAHEQGRPYLTDVRVGIPLFLRGKGIKPSLKTEPGRYLPNLDIPKTLMSLAKIKPDQGINFDGIDLSKEPEESREYAISESIYDNVYELAIRKKDKVFFQKFKINDQTCKLTDKDPILEVAYPAGFKEQEELVELDINEDLKQEFRGISTNHRKHVGLI